MILLVNNFITADECNFLVSGFRRLVSDVELKGSFIRRLPNRVELSARTFADRGFLDVHRLLTRIREGALAHARLGSATGEGLMIDFTVMSQMNIGDTHPAHADNERRLPDGSWTQNHTPHRKFTTMLYLNDGQLDFEGGVFRFTRARQEVVPRAGLLLGFDCDRTCEHEVPPVTRGSRFGIAIWYTLKREFKEEWPSSS